MIRFLQLIRFKNLAIVILTMYAMRIFFIKFLLENKVNFAIPNESLDFFLLVFSMVLIAAAGNIINDYFDVKADRINKPQRLIITKYIKRRWAIVTHWGFNFIAFFIACYLSYHHQTYLYVFVHLLYINLLWFYSLLLKRKFLIGNIVIAILTGFIPVYVSVYFLNVFHVGYLDSTWYEVIGNAIGEYFYFNPGKDELADLILNFGLGMGLFAFLSNWAREITKDIVDVKGDLLLKAKTMAIVWGEKKSKWFAINILIFSMLIYAYFIFSPDWLPIEGKMHIFAPITVALFVQLICVILLISKKEQKYKWVNSGLKISMFFGLSTPIYIVLLHI